MSNRLFGKKGIGTMPEQAPVYPLQWTCPEAHTITAVVESTEECVRELLSYTPFEYVSNAFQIWIADLKGHTIAPESNGYLEAAITIPVQYGQYKGGFSPWMFCTSEGAVLSGREILGYPKQLADIQFIETDAAVAAKVSKNGAELIRLGFAFDDAATSAQEQARAREVQSINVNRILYRTFPKPDAYSAEFGQIIYRDSARKIGETRWGRGAAFLGGSEKVPLDVLKISKIIAATYSISRYGGGLEAEKRTIVDRIEF